MRFQKLFLTSLAIIVTFPSVISAQVASENFQLDEFGVGGVAGGGTSENFTLDQEAGGLYQFDEESEASNGSTATRIVRTDTGTGPATNLTPITTNLSALNPATNPRADTIALQTFLNTIEGTNLTVDGTYDADDVAAVMAYQTKYAQAILSVWNLTEPTGYVGITTRLHMNARIKGKTAVCPVFTEYNARTQPNGFTVITTSPEIATTQDLLRDLGFYTGLSTGTFDFSTDQAMKVFQTNFNEVMLDPWNITAPTGIKYKTTNKFMNYLSGCDTGAVQLEGIGAYSGYGLN